MAEVDGLHFVRANDPNSVENALVMTVASGALALVEPRALGIGGRLAYRGALAALTGWMMWTAVRTEHEYLMPPAAKVGVTMGGVGTTLALAEAGEALDGTLHDALMRAGIRKPRLVIAALTVGASVGAWWLARRSDADLPDFEADDDEFPVEESVELSSEVRALVAALLGCCDDFGSGELSSQLEQARGILYVGEDEGAFYPGIGFEVPPELPRAVPGDASFPVIGRYRPVEGRTFDVRLNVNDGRLSDLHVLPGADWTDEENLEWELGGRSVQEIPSWPSPDELEFLIETPNGLQPV